ncbi:sensor histidine kinase [Pseudopelagicola sp. nBUS_19]|uniref:sensor histidine kinase n=1 Tax=unclassified Pseudopelagicola TaxID=2649563 RepID=UPI003EBD7390
MVHGRDGDVVLGDDWVAPEANVGKELRERRERRRLLPLLKSPLTRKIITFNLIGLLIIVTGFFYLTSARTSFEAQRITGLTTEAQLIAGAFEAQIPAGAPVNLVTGDGIDVEGTLSKLPVRNGTQVIVFDTAMVAVAVKVGRLREAAVERPQGTPLTSGLRRISGLFRSDIVGVSNQRRSVRDQAAKMSAEATTGQIVLKKLSGPMGAEVFAVAVPIEQNGRSVGAVVLTSTAPVVDQMMRSEREHLLQFFLIAIVVSVGLSILLASTISNPLSDLTAAAEIGSDTDPRNVDPRRARIPDLSARPDEIGRLSSAFRDMVAALYDRIDSNGQFAADVAHEIKNPLASLRSAVGSLRIVRKDEHRFKLLDVIEHDVRRLDRLVSDISNASRLDSDLVKEEEAQFNLLEMIRNLSLYLGEDARENGIDFVTDLPDTSVEINGLEARLAQVFVNLITNAISFCENGDAIRVWARKRENRVLVVVEDTGPGIPEQGLNKIFNRFYSHRPESEFGNNSGLGLAISKQIVEAHGGVIWAENIRPTESDVTTDPLGARFVVGLPL